MAKLESYSNLSKLQEDLWKKNFCFAQDLALSVYARTSDWTYKSSFTQKSSPVKSTCFGSSYFQYKAAQSLLKVQLTSATLSKLTAEYIPPTLKDLKIKVELESTSTTAPKRTISAEYTQEKHKSKLSVINTSDIKLSSVFGANNMGAGVDLNLDVNKFQLTGYNAALWVYKGCWRGVLKHLSTDKTAITLGDLIGSFYYTKGNKCFEVGAAVGLKNLAPSAQIALQKTFECGRVVKARIDETGTVGLALRTKLNSAVTIVTAAQFNAIDPSDSFSYGLRLKLNQ